MNPMDMDHYCCISRNYIDDVWFTAVYSKLYVESGVIGLLGFCLAIIAYITAVMHYYMGNFSLADNASNSIAFSYKRSSYR